MRIPSPERRQESRVGRSWATSRNDAGTVSSSDDDSRQRGRRPKSIPPRPRPHVPSQGGSRSIGSRSTVLNAVVHRSSPSTYSSSRRSRGDTLGRIKVGVRVRPAFPQEVRLCSRGSGKYWPVVAVGDAWCAEIDGSSSGADRGTNDVDCGGGNHRNALGRPGSQTVRFRIRDGRERCFSFDYAFGDACIQRELYQSLAAPVVEGVFEGLNGLIMTYGQTASGKTYTMGILQDRAGTVSVSPFCSNHIGPEETYADHVPHPTAGFGSSTSVEASWNMEQRNFVPRYPAHSTSSSESTARSGATRPEFWRSTDPGIIPRALCRIFENVGHMQNSSTEVSVKVSLLQIYNETVTDLLSSVEDFRQNDATGLPIREDPHIGFFVDGLWECPVTSHRQVATLINRGLQQRTIARTPNNDRSSRSHTILTVIVEQTTIAVPRTQRAERPPGAGVRGSTFTRSKMVFVDLAGSERVDRPGNHGIGGLGGERLREAGYINGSLSALGNVVAALGRAEVDRPHIPFRDSKLTRILADSLGGNANTALIATVSPAPQNQAESLSTLLFASRCMRIRSAPVSSSRNEYHPDRSEITLRLQAQVSSLRREFYRRQTLQQHRYETIITRLAQELNYSRRRNAGEKSFPGCTNVHNASAMETLPNSILPFVAAPSMDIETQRNATCRHSASGLQRLFGVHDGAGSTMSSVSTSTDGTATDSRTDGESGVDYKLIPGTPIRVCGSFCGEDLAVGTKRPKRGGDLIMHNTDGDGDISPEREMGLQGSDLRSAWEVISLTVRALEEVKHDGVEFITQALRARNVCDVADSSGSAEIAPEAADIDAAVKARDEKAIVALIEKYRGGWRHSLNEANGMLLQGHQEAARPCKRRRPEERHRAERTKAVEYGRA